MILKSISFGHSVVFLYLKHDETEVFNEFSYIFLGVDYSTSSYA